MQGSIEPMHTELEERLRFETLLAEISSRFVNVPADNVDNEIEGAQRRLCEFLNLDRSALRQVLDLDAGALHLCKESRLSFSDGRKVISSISRCKRIVAIFKRLVERATLGLLCVVFLMILIWPARASGQAQPQVDLTL